MSQIGGELEQMQVLKGTFDRESANVRELLATVRGQLDNTWWVGPAAERFRSAWAGEFEPMLNRLAESLDEAGIEVQRRRDALDAAGR
jgi:uncharacterized protein YukE